MAETAVVKRESGLFAVSDIENMAKRMVASKLFGVQNVDQAVSLMLIAQAEGMHPAIAARDYHIIQGRHTLKADAMLARFQNSGGKVEWTVYTDTKVVGVFSHPQSPTPVPVEWDMERAKRAGIGGKDNWKKYPRQMLKARVVSDGVRLCFPGCAVGVYTPEEVQDFDNTTPTPVSIVEVVALPDPRIVEFTRMAREISAVSMCAPSVTLKDMCGLVTFIGITKSVLDDIEPKVSEAYSVFIVKKSLINQAQVTRLCTILSDNKYDIDEFKKWLMDTHKIDSKKKIPKTLYDEIVAEAESFNIKCKDNLDPKSIEDCDACSKRVLCPSHE